MRPRNDKFDWETLSPFSASVLKRDAATTDYILLPAVAGLLTRIVPLLRMPEEFDDWQDVVDLARTVADESVESDDDRWATETDRYLNVADLALWGWPILQDLLPFHYVALEMATTLRGEPAQRSRLAAMLEWLRARPDASLLLTILFAAFGSADAPLKRDELPLLAKSTRKLRVEVARRLRAAGLTRWPQIVRATASAWNVDHVGQILLDVGLSAQALTAVGEDAAAWNDDGDFSDEDLEIFGDVESAEDGIQSELQPESAPPVGDDGSLAEATRLREDLEMARARIGTLEQQVASLRYERDMNADRHARVDSRVTGVTEQLADAGRRIKEVEFELLLANREREELGQLVFADEEFAPAPPDVAVAELAGKRVVLYTAQAAADAREAMRRSFFDLSAAEVDCYWTDKGFGPDRIPSDRIVVIDVSFMSHSAANRVVTSARKSGAWYCLTRHGAGMIARAVAARLLVRRGDSE